MWATTARSSSSALSTPSAESGLHRRTGRAVRLPRWPLDWIRGPQQRVEENGGGGWDGDHSDNNDGVSRGATWSPDNTVIFATINTATGLQRISAEGGVPDVLTRPNGAAGEMDHLWPEMLPGGRVVLFTITALTGGLDAAQVVDQDLQTGSLRCSCAAAVTHATCRAGLAY